jgi:hypothetical protein
VVEKSIIDGLVANPSEGLNVELKGLTRLSLRASKKSSRV